MKLLSIIFSLLIIQISGIPQEIKTASKVVSENGFKKRVEYAYYKKGLKTVYHGLFKIYIKDGGELISEENYRDGQLDGLSKYYANGKLSTEMSYREGRLNGPYKEYVDGKLESETTYKEGIEFGRFIRYYPDGKLMLEGNKSVGVDITKYGFEDGSYAVVDNSGNVEGYNLFDKDGNLVFSTKQDHLEIDRTIPGDCTKGFKTTITYPKKAKEQNKQGIVILKYTVGTDGRLKNIEAVKGFDQSAIDEAIRSMRKLNCFDIGIKDDVPVEYTLYQGIRFTLVD